MTRFGTSRPLRRSSACRTVWPTSPACAPTTSSMCLVAAKGLLVGSDRVGLRLRPSSPLLGCASPAERPPDRRLANLKLASERSRRFTGSIPLGDHLALLCVELGRPTERHATLLGPLNARLRPGHDQRPLELG